MKINLSDAAAKAVVKAGTTQITRSIQRFSRRADTQGNDVEIRLAVLASSWSYSVSDLAWKTTAKFINEGVVDTRLVDVYAPIYPASATPPGTVNETRFYAMWNGRWEMIAKEFVQRELTKSDILNTLGASETSSTVLTSVFFTIQNGYLVLGTNSTTLAYLGTSN